MTKFVYIFILLNHSIYLDRIHEYINNSWEKDTRKFDKQKTGRYRNLARDTVFFDDFD